MLNMKSSGRIWKSDEWHVAQALEILGQSLSDAGSNAAASACEWELALLYGRGSVGRNTIAARSKSWQEACELVMGASYDVLGLG